MPRLRPSQKSSVPDLIRENRFWREGASVVGIDEVGRGAWAGPLTIGAAILPTDRRIYKVRDSKMLSELEREILFERLSGWCQWSVGHVSPEEIDFFGISEALRLGTRRALSGLPKPDVVLIDGNHDFAEAERVETIVKGDQKSLSIATASVLAKVTRDRIMREQATTYPAYGFQNNKGYPSGAHKAALCRYGPSSIHRISWSYMKTLNLERFKTPNHHLGHSQS